MSVTLRSWRLARTTRLVWLPGVLCRLKKQMNLIISTFAKTRCLSATARDESSQKFRIMIKMISHRVNLRSRTRFKEVLVLKLMLKRKRKKSDQYHRGKFKRLMLRFYELRLWGPWAKQVRIWKFTQWKIRAGMIPTFRAWTLNPRICQLLTRVKSASLIAIKAEMILWSACSTTCKKISQNLLACTVNRLQRQLSQFPDKYLKRVNRRLKPSLAVCLGSTTSIGRLLKSQVDFPSLKCELLLSMAFKMRQK